MNPKIVLSPVVTAFLLLIGALVLIWRFYPLTQASAGPTSLALNAPPFVSVAKAADGAVVSTISDEAGISAYFQTPGAIDLKAVRNKFRTIERETTDYIIGSVPITDSIESANYSEAYDVHIYVQKDGWVLAYYLKQDSVSKIIDWLAYDDSGATKLTTNLENAMATIVNAAGFSSTTASYYDFRYPNATHLMLIVGAQLDEGNASFQVNVPDTFAVFERSWSFSGVYSRASYYLDEVKIKSLSGDSFVTWSFYEGVFPVSQLLPNQFHTVRVEVNGPFKAYGGLTLIYKEQ